jgi:hypothetical protein
VEDGLRVLVFVKVLLLEHGKDAEERRPLHRRASAAAGRSEEAEAR